MSPVITIIPEQGQLVDVRQRRYVVVEVAQGLLPLDVLRAGVITTAASRQQNQHLITLASVEDDAPGEELQVIWEVEPGTAIIEKSALPQPTEGFDTPHRLDAFLNSVRWGAASSADVKALQAPFRSGVDIEDYQLDPVARAIQMPRVNLLVADDVGLGKTIEAGLVAQELIIRHRARRILVICPAALQVQWQEQMRDKFGLEFRIVDSELMKDLRRQRGLHVNPWTHFPRLITSIDYLKRERPMRLFKEALPADGESTYPRRFDLLILDEAHNVAPSGRGQYATDSLRTLALRAVSPHFEHKLFLSATPHNGYPESFTSLLELLDNQRFARGVKPDKEQLGAIMIRRLNLLSTRAAYGAMVLVFQDGFLSEQIGFKVTGVIEAFVPIFVFAVLFGLSMDYHLFILTRIKELKDGGLSSVEAVAKGISGTSGTITSAATIMVVVFLVFVTIPLMVIRQVGFGLAVAVFVDAAIIRSILLPGLMRLLGDRSWYLPGWLKWIPRITIEAEPESEKPF